MGQISVETSNLLFTNVILDVQHVQHMIHLFNPGYVLHAMQVHLFQMADVQLFAEMEPQMLEKHVTIQT